MADQLQLRRGTNSEVAAFTGAQGEPIYDETNKRLVMQDGTTAGGIPAAKLSEVITNTFKTVSDANYVITLSDRIVAYTSLTAARTVTLPAANTFPPGTPLMIVDINGVVTPTNTLAITPNGTDTISGRNVAFTLHNPFDCVILLSNETNGWVFSGFVNRNLFGNRQATVSVSTTATFVLPFGFSAEFTGSAPFTVNLTSPTTAISYTPTLDLYNASSATITLSSSVGNFVGPKGSNALTVTMAAGTCLYIEWDGSNWVAKR